MSAACLLFTVCHEEAEMKPHEIENPNRVKCIGRGGQSVFTVLLSIGGSRQLDVWDFRASVANELQRRLGSTWFRCFSHSTRSQLSRGARMVQADHSPTLQAPASNAKT